MLLLRFLRLFLFIVITYAHPIFKSMDNEYIYQNKPNISNDITHRHKGYQHFKYSKLNNISRTTKDSLEFNKKAAPKEAKDNVFEAYESTKCPGEYDRNIIFKVVRNKSKNNKSIVENIKLNEVVNLETTVNIQTDFTTTDYTKNFLNLKPIMSSYDEGDLDTAEIEAVLNEIKHKEIEMIVEHDPSITTLITSTINDLVRRSILNENNISPYVSPKNLNKKKYAGTTKNYPKIKRHLFNHIFARSIIQEASTLAQNIENKLQNKIKNVFETVKKKIVHDYNKEVKYTKASLKHAYGEITKKVHNITKPPSKQPPPCTKPISKNELNKTTTKLRNSRSTERYTNLLDKKTTHTIPTLGDEFSMLTVFEQLLSKTQERNVINILTTNVSPNKRSSRYNRNSTDVNQEIIDEFEYSNKDLDFHNEEKNSDKALIRKFDSNIQPDTTTEDMSFEALSNKLSYNDYVNGYKYYLNFQKQQDDNKFSNLIRYQAHKHHKVDDIGKYILDKIPQLPTTRIKRYFVEPETLEDQDISTKTEDSWFKKHFFLFLDTDPSKKFHSKQTVTCKDSDIPKHKLLSMLPSNKNKTNNGEGYYSSQKHKKRNLETDRPTVVLRNYIKCKRNVNENVNNIKDTDQLWNKYQEPMWSNNNNNKLFQKYPKTPLNTRSTAIVKLQKKKKKNPIQVFHFFRHKEKQKQKREDPARVQRYNFFKGVKDIFKDYSKYTHMRQEKIFDYEIMTTPKPNSENMRHNFKVEELIRQIPNITTNFETIYPIFDLKYNKVNDDFLKYSKEYVFSTLKPTSKLPFEKKIGIDKTEKDIFSYDADHQKQFKLAPTPPKYNSKSTLPFQIDNKDLISTNYKNNFNQKNFDYTFSNKNITHAVRSTEYRYKLATIQPKKYISKHETEGYQYKYTSKPTKVYTIDKGMTNFLMNLRDLTLDDSYSMYKSTNGDSSRDKVLVEYKNKNNLEKYRKLPEQYFSTPLPMNVKEFNTFLREHKIDVESVTAPLKNSISFGSDKILDKWKTNRKYVPKSLNKTSLPRDKQYKLKNKVKENVKLIGFGNVKQGQYYDLNDKTLNKDAFRFTNIKTYGSFIDNMSTRRTTKVLKYPKRVQVSGHNYKYDIIFHNMKKDDDISDYISGDEIEF